MHLFILPCDLPFTRRPWVQRAKDWGQSWPSPGFGDPLQVTWPVWVSLFSAVRWELSSSRAHSQGSWENQSGCKWTVKSSQKPNILPWSHVIAQEVYTKYGCCLLLKHCIKEKMVILKLPDISNIFVANTYTNSWLSCTIKNSCKFKRKISRPYYKNKQRI